jgi:hypothetical protein
LQRKVENLFGLFDDGKTFTDINSGKNQVENKLRRLILKCFECNMFCFDSFKLGIFEEMKEDEFKNTILG